MSKSIALNRSPQGSHGNDFRRLRDGLSTNPYPHIVLENYAAPDVVAKLLSELERFEPQMRAGQKDTGGGMCYTTNNLALLGTFPALKAMEDHFRSIAFYGELVDTLGPFAEGRISISTDEMHKLIEKPELREACLKLSGTGKPYKVRGPHLDAPTSVLTYLYYLRLDNDVSSGGDFNLLRDEAGGTGLAMRLRSKILGRGFSVVKSVEYKSNTLVAFLNTAESYHEVSTRQVNTVSRIAYQGSLSNPQPVF